MSHVRPATVAGMFYPGSARALETAVRSLLANATVSRPSSCRPKAIIAPHAGYIYSGPVAASVYACLRPFAAGIRRVVLIGPSHRVPLRGMAATGASAFATPLGPVPVDAVATAEILNLPQVALVDAAHAEEHSLEVHLPFLQQILGEFTLVPLVAGDATADEVAEVLNRLWSGPETLIVVSSDLSHYLDYASARARDAATTDAIERLAPAGIEVDQACGRVPLAGLLCVARQRGLNVKTVDVRNSGDTAGDRRRVVGYGAWLFTEPVVDASASCAEDCALEETVASYGGAMRVIAWESITRGFDSGKPMTLDSAKLVPALATHGASFVTLRRDGQLRGCIGTAHAFQPLAADIAKNAFAAAFSDHRFAPLQRAELGDLAVTVSILGAPTRLAFASERELLAMLCPGKDGLIIEADGHRALFLPQVWKTIPDPRDFLVQLKRKAKLADDAWPEGLAAWRFAAMSVPAEDGPPTR